MSVQIVTKEERMAKAKKLDPFMITDNEAGELKNQVSTGSSGLICPKRNKSISKPCGTCDYIQTAIYDKKYPMQHAAMGWARTKKAKLGWFLNVVFPENPDKAILFELGDKAGNQIVTGIEKLDWRDIVHPHKGVGRELTVTKSKAQGESWPTYTVSPSLNKADWAVPDEVWKNVPNLNDIIGILESTVLDNDNYKHVRSIKMDETLTFRILPPIDDGSTDKKLIAAVYRHWGVTQGQLDGVDPHDWRASVDSEDAETDVFAPDAASGAGMAMPKSEPDRNTDTVPALPDKTQTQKDKVKKPPCYGMKKFFDMKDEVTCGPCPAFKSCGREVMAQGDDDIPF